MREALTSHQLAAFWTGAGSDPSPVAAWSRAQGQMGMWACVWKWVCPHTHQAPPREDPGGTEAGGVGWRRQDRGQSQEDPSPRRLCSGPCFGSRVFSSPLKL